jgi:hypothetical protein
MAVDMSGAYSSRFKKNLPSLQVRWIHEIILVIASLENLSVLHTRFKSTRIPDSVGSESLVIPFK